MTFITKAAEVAVSAGFAMIAGGYAADLATCPGEVERVGSHEVPVLVCDEDPEHDDGINNPGTVYQKMMLGGTVMLVSGLTIQFIFGRRKDGEAPAAQATTAEV